VPEHDPEARRSGNTFADRFDAFCERMNRVLEVTIALLLAATVIVALLQVIFRYGLNSSLSWSEELARYLFIWVIFLGTSSATRHGHHMAVEALASVMPAVARRSLAAVVTIVSLVFFGVVLYASIVLTENAIPQLSTALEISVAYVYVAAPIGVVLTMVHLLNQLTQIASGRNIAPQQAAEIS
jgi:TRAP-type C4-dicarboxylate transport system permease small subunit